MMDDHHQLGSRLFNVRAQLVGSRFAEPLFGVVKEELLYLFEGHAGVLHGVIIDVIHVSQDFSRAACEGTADFLPRAVIDRPYRFWTLWQGGGRPQRRM